MVFPFWLEDCLKVSMFFFLQISILASFLQGVNFVCPTLLAAAARIQAFLTGSRKGSGSDSDGERGARTCSASFVGNNHGLSK